MYLIVGLGNPGDEYRATRHNVGFDVVDVAGDRAGATFSDKRFKARLARGVLANEPVLLMKPQGYMNLSGESVGPCVGFFKIPTERVLVVHDDMDLPLGRLRLKKGGGHGGHNGLRSLIQHLPDADFIRMRFGIGRPPPDWEGRDFVLSRFKGEERGMVERAVTQAVDAIEVVLRDGLAKAMNAFNRTDKGSEEAA